MVVPPWDWVGLGWALVLVVVGGQGWTTRVWGITSSGERWLV
jgi:hypothetical protein